jgi:hypothetical protein
MRLCIGLFKVNTQATQNVSVADRVDCVKAATQELKRYTESAEKNFTTKDPVELRAVFLAPEYAFARSVSTGNDHGFGQRRQIEEDYVKNTWRPIFGEVSKGFRNALIVPGTVAWRKSLTPATKGKFGSVGERETYRRDKYEQRIRGTIDINLDEGHAFDANTPVFPVAYKRRDDHRADLPSAASKMSAIQTAHYIAKNTAHCFYNGDCVYKYNKIGDFYEVSEDTQDTVMVPNRKSKVSGTNVGAGRFSAGGLEIGISICYDQSLSVQDSVDVNIIEPLQKTAGAVDLHIILSAHIPPDVGAANLKPGGFLLSCSSKNDCNGVLFYNGMKFSHAEQSNIKGMAKLDIFQLLT